MSLQCPSCGAPYAEITPATVIAHCRYCGAVSTWDGRGLADSGRRSRLSEGFTRLYCGASGKVRDKRFIVEGRVRYSYGQGFWDEWYLTFIDGSSQWLTEDDHELSIQYPLSSEQLGGMKEFLPNSWLKVQGRNFMITEVGEARCLGVEGQLSKSILPDEVYRYADGTSPDGAFALGIEFDDDPPTLFMGEWLRQGELSIDGENL